MRAIRTGIWIVAAAVVSAAMSAVGCQSSPEVERAPLADDRQKKLERTMLGAWEHRFVVPEGGSRKPVEDATRIWAFEKDGTGTYREGAPTGEAETTAAFAWRLEGRNIAIERKDSGETTYYRAETWSPRQMRWHVYESGAVYVLRQASGDRTEAPRPAGSR